MKKLEKLSSVEQLGTEELKSISGGGSMSIEAAFPTEFPCRELEDTWTGGIRPATDSVLYVDETTDQWA